METIFSETMLNHAVNSNCTPSTTGVNSKLSTVTDFPLKDRIYLQADKGIIRDTGVSSLDGSIIIQQNNLLFNANSAKIHRENHTVSTHGNVILSTPELIFKSQDIDYNLKKNTGSINRSIYTYKKNGFNGKSERISLSNNDHLRLMNATFTTCPASTDSWYFSSSSIALNNKKNIGTAKNVTLRFSDIPVFYFPWLNFPINNQRASGFLIPKIRFQSNAGISIPYYLNLAPNYDATLTLSTFKNSGLKLDSEFRYLYKQHKGIFKYDLIPDDKEYNDKTYRDYFNLKHRTLVSENTAINLQAEGVSDKDYFADISTSLEDSSRSALQRRIEIINKQGAWFKSAAFEDYQILDISSAPYAKLPELKLQYIPVSLPNTLKYSLKSEYVYFDKNTGATGSRAHIKLQASKKWSESSWFIHPSLSLKHTIYSLKDNIQNSLSRSVPTFTLDTGLLFDRELKSATYAQTLEPRLFYTFTPFKTQNNIPIFDTAQTNFSATNQLFSENRFTGKDRIADNNQLTFAVTSRIQNRKNSKELIKVSIGQVFNFSDKKVILPGGSIQTGQQSDLVLELGGRLNDNFRFSSTGLWSHDKNRAPSYELRLNYQDGKKRIANISYRKLDTELKQFTISSSIPFGSKWSAISSIDYDMKNNRNLETLFGLEYSDCCWKTRIVAKRYLTSDNINYETPIFLEFELKGIGSVGTGARRQLRERIYGYDDY